VIGRYLECSGRWIWYCFRHRNS